VTGAVTKRSHRRRGSGNRLLRSPKAMWPCRKIWGRDDKRIRIDANEKITGRNAPFLREWRGVPVTR